MYLKILRDSNPWWTEEEWEERDKNLVDYRNQRIRWVPEWIKKLSLEPFSLNFVLGLRQIGKTTGLKLLIRELVKTIEAENVIYIDCDIFPDFESLGEAIIEYLNAVRSEETKYVFLDEVTSISEWWKAVKYMIDTGKFGNCVVTVTGSSSLKVRRDIELFPGRTGKGKVVEVLPLSFKEYVEVHGVKNYKLEYDRVVELFKKYLETGGFPLTINGFSSSHILNAIIGEIVRFRKSLEIAKETLASLISKMPSAVSFRAIAQDTSGYSYKTVQEYLEFFKNLYVLDFAYLKQGSRVLYRKERKVFFRDPLLLNVFSAWSNTSYLYSALIENVVQEHLYRKFGEIYYYRNSYEIDCIADDLKVEVKAGKPHRRYPRDVIVLSDEEIPKFLIELFK
ncbi:DEXX-box atpase [Ferroglobus placidus DSM 10642]|uniref:DEXX-box atpase n=1 Tax=Ferroglobus placidus (strain DSM 10642 / AEDII12DO) TaxID=589924 RepID=D3S240_FERPA|nr:ATP-binding protein [Ferroglobus placidus]ADC66531.1 DEXX-box atpase [Ferroglobus placidus DSM 10642]